jgi:hypothetical protein
MLFQAENQPEMHCAARSRRLRGQHQHCTLVFVFQFFPCFACFSVFFDCFSNEVLLSFFLFMRRGDHSLAAARLRLGAAEVSTVCVLEVEKPTINRDQ